MEHLLSAVWPEIAARIRKADQVQLLTDFDGTLSPIAGRPEDAVLPDGTRETLEAVASHLRVGVGVVSGRALDDIKRKVGIRGITYAGNHGIEIEGPFLRFVYPPAESVRPLMQRIAAALRQALAGIDGVVLEDKGLTLSVHYRLVSGERVEEVLRACEEAVRVPRSEGKVRTTGGKKVYEVRPGVLWNKENAIVLLLACWSPSENDSAGLAMFLGDDLTDELGFDVVNARGGISVFVGEPDRPTAARYFLRSPDEVREFLRRVLGELRDADHGPS